MNKLPKIKSEIALSIENMKLLEELGFDTSDASMCWCKDPNGKTYQLFLHNEFCYEASCLDPVPAYTLEDIMLKFPGQLSYNPEIAANQEKYLDESSEDNLTKEYKYAPWVWVYEINEIWQFSYGFTPMEAAFKGILAFHKKRPDIANKVPKINQ